MSIYETEAGILKVHVDNAGEIANGHPVETREKEAEHISCSSWFLPTGDIVPGGTVEPQQLLNLDPLRKRAVIGVNGTGQAIFCHSIPQAISSASTVTSQPDEGFVVTAPCTFTVEATGPLWVVPASGATGMIVSVLQERRNRA
jgi:hypothetical protein